MDESAMTAIAHWDIWSPAIGPAGSGPEILYSMTINVNLNQIHIQYKLARSRVLSSVWAELQPERPLYQPEYTRITLLLLFERPPRPDEPAPKVSKKQTGT